MPDAGSIALYRDELDVLNELIPLDNQNIIELGCGAAGLARGLLKRFPGCRVTGLEVDQIQHAKNLESPQDGLTFLSAGAQEIPFPDASFDLAMMLKSLHHVPRPLMAQALGEAARVLRRGGHLYVSEPVYGGAFNEVIRTYNDEGAVRAAAQGALDVALAETDHWVASAEIRFTMTARYRDFDEFERKHMRSSFATYELSPDLVEAARREFEKLTGPEGLVANRLHHVRLFRRR